MAYQKKALISNDDVSYLFHDVLQNSSVTAMQSELHNLRSDILSLIHTLQSHPATLISQFVHVLFLSILFNHFTNAIAVVVYDQL